MNRAKRKRIEELKTKHYTPKNAYALMKFEAIDNNKFNHAVWNENGNLEKVNGSNTNG